MHAIVQFFREFISKHSCAAKSICMYDTVYMYTHVFVQVHVYCMYLCNGKLVSNSENHSKCMLQSPSNLVVSILVMCLSCD